MLRLRAARTSSRAEGREGLVASEPGEVLRESASVGRVHTELRDTGARRVTWRRRIELAIIVLWCVFYFVTPMVMGFGIVNSLIIGTVLSFIYLMVVWKMAWLTE